ncbi:sugar phosphate isomerase/epimerase family protein [Deinococcus peraridilitoris]|uniref:Sugar phosphate isomerase/epimerase n=1 Tax=Deinococcus peraridilitoris (strain DSM 19664 / LMG 22246 / CIP 109416 / KR-200) TaxID=937777 RepID=L0A6Z5_DEIPD|nr:sugar phosphate isomerase/epimerase [Deinococcus peraridilitoris]AFZ69219.1 sugar phosphate isomerase/epimerase [Deinococcus peraridilitoris DSM 19664]
MTVSIGLQLYTLRNELMQDFEGTLRRVAELGFHGVEFAGYGGYSATDLRALIDSLGLKAAATHVSLDRLRTHLDAEIDFMTELGGIALVCPWANTESEQEWLAIADDLDLAAQACEARGLKLAYHNHAHEISRRAGSLPVMDALLTRAPRLHFEIDVAWVYAGGGDPVAYLQEYADRVPLVHLKDVRPKADTPGEWDTVELGAGTVDLQAAMQMAGDAVWWLVEQDHSPHPLASVEASVRYLRAQGVMS